MFGEILPILPLMKNVPVGFSSPLAPFAAHV